MASSSDNTGTLQRTTIPGVDINRLNELRSIAPTIFNPDGSIKVGLSDRPYDKLVGALRSTLDLPHALIAGGLEFLDEMAGYPAASGAIRAYASETANPSRQRL